VTTTGSGREVARLEIPERGLFGSGRQEWAVDDETPEENRLEITAIPYAEEDPMSLAYAVMCGDTLDGRSFPWAPNNGLGIDARWVSQSSLAGATSQRRRTLKGYKKIKALDFLEKEILSQMPGELMPNSRGELEFRSALFGSAAATSATLNPDNCYGKSLGKLVHDASDVRHPLSFEWDYHPIYDTFRQVTEFIDEDAANEAGANEPLVIQSRLISTARSTESEV